MLAYKILINNKLQIKILQFITTANQSIMHYN